MSDLSPTTITERLAKITPGAWRSDNDGHGGLVFGGDPEQFVAEVVDGPDCEFITHAPDDIRYLLGLRDAALALHTKTKFVTFNGPVDVCSQENTVWPCPTVIALGGNT